jgi:hypothetical protein
MDLILQLPLTYMIELKRLQEEEEEEPETEPETERQQAITKIRFGEPYENTRKHSKFDLVDFV